MTQTPEKTKLKNLTFFIIAGEEAGDIHGSRLILAIKKKYSDSIDFSKVSVLVRGLLNQ